MHGMRLEIEQALVRQRCRPSSLIEYALGPQSQLVFQHVCLECDCRSSSRGNRRAAAAYVKCFFANARPDPDFRYFSKAIAVDSLSNSRDTRSCHGRNVMCVETRPNCARRASPQYRLSSPCSSDSDRSQRLAARKQIAWIGHAATGATGCPSRFRTMRQTVGQMCNCCRLPRSAACTIC